ncbi:FAD/NAD-P-binding domain-containing protein [Vararia minispora EC-137]|uniref:FAD/NAD-P-binding domain-containing protein n=1 Tax=Vararia minispora EC-137 TaxID=1314806 RepID=A0ACB8QTV6_9AGAM|nr:FAD/NAD-P-binding domain-containing protein [Vararia minispora EC-137]
MPGDKKQIIIVGGGFAGGLLARTLSKDIDSTKHSLTLITARPFSVLYPASIRMAVTSSGSLEDKVLVPYDKLFHNNNGKVVIGRVVTVEATEGDRPGSVVLADGSRFSYDILVLAPGSSWSGPVAFPDTKEETLAHIQSWREKFASAKSVAVVGGGPVGVECAGELRDFYPGKKVTIVHRDRLLINDFFPDKFRKAVGKDIRAAGVDLILNDSLEVTGTPEGAVSTTTRTGKAINVDLIVPAFGGKPATDFLHSMGTGILSSTGHIRVKKTLQLVSHPNIFAAGDAIESSQSRQIFQATDHANIIAINVRDLLNGRTPAKEYGTSLNGMFVSNGRERGVGYVGMLWGLVLGNWMVSRVKGRDLLVGRGRAGLGMADA